MNEVRRGAGINYIHPTSAPTASPLWRYSQVVEVLLVCFDCFPLMLPEVTYNLIYNLICSHTSCGHQVNHSDGGLRWGQGQVIVLMVVMK